MSSALPYMPLFARDALAEGLALDAATFGIDMRLRCAWWASGGHLPDDVATLGRFAGVSRAVMEKARRKLLQHGWRVAEGELFRPEMRADFLKASERSEAARSSAKSRWKNETKHADASTGASADAVPTNSNSRFKGSISSASDVTCAAPLLIVKDQRRAIKLSKAARKLLARLGDDELVTKIQKNGTAKLLAAARTVLPDIQLSASDTRQLERVINGAVENLASAFFVLAYAAYPEHGAQSVEKFVPWMRAGVRKKLRDLPLQRPLAN